MFALMLSSELEWNQIKWKWVSLFGLTNLQWKGVVHNEPIPLKFPFFVPSQFGGNEMKSYFSLLIENN